MDGRGGSRAAVAELRLRRSRPDPSVGAVAASLSAPHVQPPRPRGDGSPPTAPRPHGRVLTALGVILAVVAAAVAADAVGRLVPVLVETSTVHETSGALSGSDAIPAPPLMGTPLGDLSGRGPATGRFTANGHLVVASVLCSGVGTLSVRIGAAPPTLLSCERGGPALAIVESTTRLDRFTIVVTPDSPIRWSLAASALDR